MRLIDADLFLENAKNELNCEGKCCECDYYNLCEIYKTVEKQPTAYDVDKVVERLETLSDRADDKIMEQEGSEQYWDGFGDGIDEAIKILKSGGIE